ncbi:MAG: hypothetical protein HFI75_09260 [Lachnospiraceae bacterium]|nr:hypothetical protein [Lachnospiraceae bacterium]
MKKKVISYLLCGTMTAAMLLGGCSSDKESDKKNDDKKTSQEADQDKASEKPDSQEEPDAKNYEAYLDWKQDQFNAASDDEKKDAARAYMIYSAQKGGTDITMDDIDQVPDSILPDAISQMQQFYAQDTEGRSIKQITDDNYAAASNLNIDLDSVDLGEYDTYLDYTNAKYVAAPEEEQKKVLTAYYLGVTGTNAADADVNNLEIDFETLDSSLRQMYQGMPGKTVREILKEAGEMFN